MVEADFETWDRLLFRDYLIEFPETAQEYAVLKTKLSKIYQDNRSGYTESKGRLIKNITEKAKGYFRR